MIKKIFFSIALCIVLPSNGGAQSAVDVLHDFFFDLPFDVDIDALRSELKNDTTFKFYNDPNRDTSRTIVGTISVNKNLNPVCLNNQVIIQYSSAVPRKSSKVSLKWSMTYKLGDLASARVDYDKLKAQFVTLFSKSSEIEKIGVHKEKISTVTLKNGDMVVTIKLIQYINFTHTVSLEYRDIWNTEATNVFKIKN